MSLLAALAMNSIRKISPTNGKVTQLASVLLMSVHRLVGFYGRTLDWGR